MLVSLVVNSLIFYAPEAKVRCQRISDLHSHTSSNSRSKATSRANTPALPSFCANLASARSNFRRSSCTSSSSSAIRSLSRFAKVANLETSFFSSFIGVLGAVLRSAIVNSAEFVISKALIDDGGGAVAEEGGGTGAGTGAGGKLLITGGGGAEVTAGATLAAFTEDVVTELSVDRVEGDTRGGGFVGAFRETSGGLET